MRKETMHDDLALGFAGSGVDLRRGRVDKSAREGAGKKEEWLVDFIRTSFLRSEGDCLTEAHPD